MQSLFGSGIRCAATDRPWLVSALDTLVEGVDSEHKLEVVGSPMDDKLGTLGIVGTGGRLPWAIFSANFSADLAAVGLRRLRIQFCSQVCVCVCVKEGGRQKERERERERERRI